GGAGGAGGACRRAGSHRIQGAFGRERALPEERAVRVLNTGQTKRPLPCRSGLCVWFQAVRPVRAPSTAKRANTPRSTATMVEPTGVPARMEIRMPAAAPATETTAEQMVTALKLLNSRMADSAGKM